MAQKDPASVAKKWASNLGNSTSSITDGVNAVTQSPTASAAKAVDRWSAAMQAQRTKDKFVKGLNAVTLGDWQQAMLTKGVPRVASGAQAATPKMQDFMTKLLPYTAQVSAKVQAMPKLNLNDSIARATTAITEMAKFSK